MAPRATQASQSQRNGRAGPSQSQSRRVSRRDADEQEDDNEEQDYDEDEEEAEYDDAASASQKSKKKSKAAATGEKKKKTGATGNMSAEEIRRHAYELVRMALFEEPKRGVLKRADIAKKILPENSRQVQIVFDTAQLVLQRTFGMEMVELMTRAERDSLSETKEEGSGDKKKGTTSTSKTYIVRSILNPLLVRLATSKDNDIAQAEHDSMIDVGIVRADEGFDPPRGTILEWDATESVALFGVLQLLLCLILVNGRSITEPQLKAQLKHFHLHWTTKISLPPNSGASSISFEDYLALLIKQNYLDRIRQEAPGAGPTQATQKARRKSRMNDQQDDGTFEWKWGTRAHAEMGEESVAQFMADFSRDRWVEDQRQLLRDEMEDEEEAQAGGNRKKKKNAGEKTIEEKLAELDDNAIKYGDSVLKDIRLSSTQAAQPLTDIKWVPPENGNPDAMEE